ncbi:MAG: DUF4350 domain-containing protein [Rhizobiaceae bacterium]
MIDQGTMGVCRSGLATVGKPLAIWFTALFFTLCPVACDALAQKSQGPDLDYAYANASPAWPQGTGPRIVFSGKNSIFVRNGSHKPFARLAREDGYQVLTRDSDIDGEMLEKADILIIINAYQQNFRDFPAMLPPSAFQDSEIDAIHAWVERGGSLLILADHAPLGGGTSKLASTFGFDFLNGHTVEDAAARSGHVHVNNEFTLAAGLNANTPVTDGSTGREKISHFQAFGGQAFIPAPGAIALLTLPQGWSAVFTYRIEPDLNSAPRIDASGMSQGAILDYGKGRVGVFAEAGGFTAQIISDGRRFGFNTPEGRDNPEFVLSLLRWLARFEAAR